MDAKDLTITNGVAAGDWIKPRLGGKFGAVTQHVPKGFDAYARIFHPAFDSLGNPVSWEKVAHASGTIPHRQMQWHAILGFESAEDLQGSYSPEDETGRQWAGWDPPTGAMPIDVLDELCRLLDVYTTDATRCFFGLCMIRGWHLSISPDDPGLLKLPYERDYVVLAGPLSAVDQIMHDWLVSTQIFFTGGAHKGSTDQSLSDFKQRAAPNLFWPADHSWLVTSEVDFDSTLVGGSRPLIQAIVEADSLEAREVRPTDSLADDADLVNVHRV